MECPASLIEYFQSIDIEFDILDCTGLSKGVEFLELRFPDRDLFIKISYKRSCEWIDGYISPKYPENRRDIEFPKISERPLPWIEDLS